MEGIQVDQEIGTRVRALRSSRGMRLEDLAARSGVSRAMLSRIERGESSPTAQLLNRVCGGLGVTLSTLFAEAERQGSPLRRRRDQPQWRDPGSGYARRVVSPEGTGSPVEMVEVEFPAGGEVTFGNLHLSGIDQHIHVLDGSMEIAVDGVANRLDKGDCLHMRLDQAIRFANPFGREARYLVVLSRGGGR
ncbi:MAG: helix-turn-helix domain-containing protein [Bauldia sp.]